MKKTSSRDAILRALRAAKTQRRLVAGHIDPELRAWAVRMARQWLAFARQLNRG